MVIEGARNRCLTILYHFVPWLAAADGIASKIAQQVRFAPQELRIRIVGCTDGAQPTGRWLPLPYEGRNVDFLALFKLPPSGIKPRIPNTLRFASGLAGHRIESDFIHAHRLELGVLASRWRGEKTLFFHLDTERALTLDASNSEYLWARMPGLYRVLESRLIERFDRLVECSQASLEDHQNRYPAIANRFFLQPNTFDPTIFHPPQAQESEDIRARLSSAHGIDPERPLLVYAGQLQPIKNPLLAIEALPLTENLRHVLVVCGDGNLRGALAQRVRELGQESHVRIVGIVGHQELADLLKVSDALLLPSRSEALPTIVLEALACGTPVVSTPCGDVTTLVAATGGQVSRGFDPEGFARAVDTLLRAPPRRDDVAGSALVRQFDAGISFKREYARMLGRVAGAAERDLEGSER